MAPSSRRRALVAAFAAALSLLAAACSSGEAVASGERWQTVVDTVADTVIVRTVGASDDAARLQLVPELQIGEFDGDEEYQFANVSFVLPAPDGGVYVWDRTLVALRQYDSTGAFVRQIGRKGGGPGEYEYANGIVLRPDGNLVLWDPRNTRMTVYDSAGTVVTSWRFESSLSVGGSNGLLGDTLGNAYALHWFRMPEAERDPLPGQNAGYMVVGPDGAIRDSVFPPRSSTPAPALVASREGGTSVNNVPFAPRLVWAWSPLGYFVSGTSDRYALTLARPGALPLRLERDAATIPVDPDEKANWEEITTANMRGTDPAWRWNGPAIPDAKPHFRNLLVAADGRILVLRSQPGVRVEPDTAERSGSRAPARRWREPFAYDVFTPDGRFVGHLPLPEGTSIAYLRGDHAWGVMRDELDVPTVVRWRIETGAVNSEQ